MTSIEEAGTEAHPTGVTPLKTIDLNADLGEGCPWDYALLGRVTSAGVCCGAHAGDPDAILQTLRWARDRGVTVGAHPGYADREGFGRRDMNLSFVALGLLVEAQMIEFERLAALAGVPVRFVKPHGALYNQAHREVEVATAMLQPVFQRGLPVLGLPSGLVERIAGELEIPFVSEGFADRRYQPNGQLVPRTSPDAMLRSPQQIRDQVRSLVDRGIKTLCLHGDDPGAVDLADLVLGTLKSIGVQPRSFA